MKNPNYQSWMPEFTKENLEHCEGFEGPCENTDAEWYGMNCLYQDERSNWRYLCKECQIASDEYWNDMWQDAVGVV